MAKGGGGKGGKGKGGGRGPTQRSQNYLAQYGYPSNKALSREAARLAEGSVGSIREVNRPFQRQAQSARDFLTAVQAALGEAQGQVNAGYGQATQQQGAVDQAAQARLAALGLGSDAAGVQAVQGARGDSATANLLSNEASAKAFAAAQPGIASGNTGVVLAGLRKQQTDALAARRDQLRQSFFQAFGQVQQNALARAGFNQSADQFQQQMAATQQANAQAQANADRAYAEGVREFKLGRKDARQKAAAAGFTPLQIQGFHSDIYDSIQAGKKGVPLLGAHRQLRHGLPGDIPGSATGRLRWRVPPAPNGAPHEPGQPNSIFGLYTLLSNKYSDPSLQPLILTELKMAYPKSTWRIFLSAMQGQSGQGARPRAALGG